MIFYVKNNRQTGLRSEYSVGDDLAVKESYSTGDIISSGSSSTDSEQGDDYKSFLNSSRKETFNKIVELVMVSPIDDTEVTSI
jgi:hypothetical protein